LTAAHIDSFSENPRGIPTTVVGEFQAVIAGFSLESAMRHVAVAAADAIIHRVAQKVIKTCHYSRLKLDFRQTEVPITNCMI